MRIFFFSEYKVFDFLKPKDSLAYNYLNYYFTFIIINYIII